MDTDVRVEILGPIRAFVGETEVAVTAERERALLAVLLLHAGEVVPMERLVEAIWGDRPPRDVRNQVQVCVSRLRKRLAGAGASSQVIATNAAGYLLRVGPEGGDLPQFRRLVAAARAAAADGRLAEARDRYRDGLELWRGPALAGIDSGLVGQAAVALDEERVRAVEERIEVELSLGAGGELVPELTDLVRHHPYRENLHGALMRALYQAGRHADALAAYRKLRGVLHDELGTEPGPELQRLHQSILSRDPELSAPPPGPPRPRELPAEASCFVGREREVARLRQVLTLQRCRSGSQASPDGRARRRPAVTVLYGPGGVGKSALAVRAAHDLAAEFPDGQLYADLFGSTPGMRPVPAAETLGRLLRSLGVHPAEVPSGEVEAAALFRSMTADRRLLLVLDNAASRDQIAALVPSAPTCAVLVTSRHPLSTLDADDWLPVGGLPDDEALWLLAGLTGGRTVAPEAAREIVAHSGGLPLAVRIAAGRLATRPDLPAGEYADRLADRSRRLDELELDDLAVRASIRTGYDALLTGGGPAGQVAARAFRALGLLHVPDVAPGVVAAMLTEPDVAKARSALDRLVDAQLLEPVPPGRYRLHDLVRLVAAERATEEDTPADRDQTLHRALAFYAAASRRADLALGLLRSAAFHHPPAPDYMALPAIASPAQAGGWLDEELPSLISVLQQITAMDGDVRRHMVVPLCDVLWPRLNVRCEWRTAHRVTRLVLELAERREDRELTAWSLLFHGRSEACLTNYELAATYLERSITAWRDLGKNLYVALALNGLGIVNARRGRPADALANYTEARNLVRCGELDDHLEALILSNMCVPYAMLGDLDGAAAVGEESASLCAVRGLTPSPSILVNYASVQCLRGRLAEAMRHADVAVALYEKVGHRLHLFEALIIRSEASRRSGNLALAAAEAERALSLAKTWNFRFGVAAGQRMCAKILATMGRNTDAAKVRAKADLAYAELTNLYRDYLTDLLLAQDDPLDRKTDAGLSAGDR